MCLAHKAYPNGTQDPAVQQRLRDYVDKELPKLRLAQRKQAGVDHILVNATVSTAMYMHYYVCVCVRSLPCYQKCVEHT